MTDMPNEDRDTAVAVPVGVGVDTLPALGLRFYPDPVLRHVCELVERFDTRLTDLVHAMITVMRYHHGVGLAAPQVGINERFLVMDAGDFSLCLINPSIACSNGHDRMTEGCLSLPGERVAVTRRTCIDVTGYNLAGNRCRHRLQGLAARIVQHEIDHLNGVLITDHGDNTALTQPKMSSR